jgi:hypothetical protein
MLHRNMQWRLCSATKRANATISHQAFGRFHHGSTNGRVHWSYDDPKDVVVLLDMTDVETTGPFAECADLQAAREQVAGVGMPALHFLHGSAE